MKIVATMSLPAVDRQNADRWNAARSRQYKEHQGTSRVTFSRTGGFKEALSASVPKASLLGQLIHRAAKLSVSNDSFPSL